MVLNLTWLAQAPLEMNFLRLQCDLGPLPLV